MPGVKGEIAPIYRAAAHLHVHPLVLDDMEVWQIAAMFGVDMDDDAHHASGDDDWLPPGVGDMRKGWIDPNVINRAKRAMGQDAPDVRLGGYSPRLGVLA